MAKSPGEGPRLRSLYEIDMGLVKQAHEIRTANSGQVPVSAEATELVRYLRAVGAFEGNGFREEYVQVLEEGPVI
ncbi:TPA: hypothetical protein DIS56_02460 [Candidatus Saccharibacteria bacterium]|nr:hypothetical protein [Candidatus Saccharibacteria bacterium]